jgi:ComF family protein
MSYRWLGYLQQLIYPPTCLLCGAAGSDGLDLCAGCREELPANSNPCRCCAQPLPPAAPVGSLCGACLRKTPPFERCLAPLLYQYPVGELVSGLKFHQKLSHGRVMAELLLAYIEQEVDEPPQLLIPVPLHETRLRERGYNQALELARPISRSLGIPLDFESCHRIRPTEPQSALQLKERYKNVRGAFEIKAKIPARHVALVDDVVTTGNTVAELSRLLKRHGVKRVDVWAVARTP